MGTIGESDSIGHDDRDIFIDPDYDVHDPAQVGELPNRQWDILAVIAVGGVLGAESRFGVGLLIPHQPGEFAWATVLVNASGCLLIGVLLVVLLELTSPHRLMRPFLGVGILGGFTTFSTFAVDVQQMILAHRVGSAMLYLLVTLGVCAFAVWAATTLTRVLGHLSSQASSRRRAERKPR